MWARQLLNANASYQILTIGDSTHINDNRFLITKSTVNNVRKTLIIDLKSGKIDFTLTDTNWSTMICYGSISVSKITEVKH